MCLQDIQIARATTAYIRQVTITGSPAQVLPGNPRRYALVLPTVEGTDSVIWSFSNLIDGTGLLSSTFITGLLQSNTDFYPLQSVDINLIKNGSLVIMPVFAATKGGSTVVVSMIEVLFNIELPPLQVP